MLAAMEALSLRQALGRLVSQVALARPGTSIEAAREAVAGSFDVALEVVRLWDGFRFACSESPSSRVATRAEFSARRRLPGPSRSGRAMLLLGERHDATNSDGVRRAWR